jgi:hypothetical protein
MGMLVMLVMFVMFLMFVVVVSHGNYLLQKMNVWALVRY